MMTLKAREQCGRFPKWNVEIFKTEIKFPFWELFDSPVTFISLSSHMRCEQQQHHKDLF